MRATPQTPTSDPRKARTRADLLQAFFGLVLDRRYHEIAIADVLVASGVAKSTFYEHFASKDALLAASLEGPLEVLAGLVDGTSSASDAERILQHFHDYGTVVRSLLKGPAFRVVRGELVGRVEARLDRGLRSRMRIAPRIASCTIADATLSPIVAWLDGEAACTTGELSLALEAAVRGLRDAFVRSPAHPA
jgi:AcrR family transcriptional regulator